MAAGDAWRDQGFYIRAVNAYSLALERDRGNFQITLWRGQARWGTNQTEQWQLALSDFREAITLAEHDPTCQRECQLARGQTYLKQQDFRRALTEYTDLLNRNPHDVAALIGRGAAYGYNRQYEPALRSLDEAVYLEPKNPLTYLARAEVRTRQYNLRGALKDVDAALLLDPSSPRAYQIRGEALVKDRKWGPAFEAFAQALVLQPNSASIYLARAAAYDAKKDAGKAAADRQHAASIDAPGPAVPAADPANVAGRESPRR